MYEAFFHLDRRPFIASPRTDHYFPARSIEQARQSLTRCISRSEGPGAIIGPSGTGKSLLCFVLAKQFRDKMKVAVVQGGRLRTRKSLLQNVLFELKQPFRGMDEDELRLSLLDYLEAKDPAQRRLLLIIDDAHLIRGQVLADIAALCGHVRDGEPIIQFVLAGGPSLEEKLAHPRLESLQQRIAARCYLQALSYDETASFIKAQVENCGGQLENVIANDAVAALYRASDGVPRLINQIGDHALLLAYLAKLHPVNKAAIEEAWSDLQQLPTPWQVTDHPASVAAKEESSSIIEFGSLDDAPQAPIGPAPDTASSVPIWESNPVFNVEQNLWTIESGLQRIHQAAADTNDFSSQTENLPSICLSHMEVEENDMPQFAPVQRIRPAKPTIPISSDAATMHAAPAKPIIKRIANPFEGQFEAEEVIQDRLARKAPVVTAPIATKPIELRVENAGTPPGGTAAAPVQAPELRHFDEDRLEQFDGVSIDWMNYQATSVVGVGAIHGASSDAWNVVNTDGTTVSADARQDDRGVLLVENDQPPRIRPVKRQEFRQLFAKMRGDQ
jgi:type II secretory pathway predicted ATPase ExeA